MPVSKCQHAPCGKAFPPGTDRRKRFCNDACRKAHNRAERAAEGPPLALVHPILPKAGEGHSGPLTEDVVSLWEAFMQTLKTDGLMVTGSAGTPVSHPLLRHFSALYGAAKEALGAAPGDEGEDEFTKLMAAARKRIDAINDEEAARYV